MERFREIGSDKDSLHRIEMWEAGYDMFKKHPVLGVGYENFGAVFQVYYDPEAKVSASHNIFVQAASELGSVGVIVYLILIWTNFSVNRNTRKISEENGHLLYKNLALGFSAALVAFLVGGMFVTVLYYPFFWFNLSFSVALNNITRRKYMGKPGAGRKNLHKRLTKRII